MMTEIEKYTSRMRHFKLWLASEWFHYGNGNGVAPTVRKVAKRYRVSRDMILQMCEDANAHGFDVSVSACDNVGDRIIELL